MKKVLIAALVLFLSIVIAGCNKESKPEERFSEYIKLWNEQHFDKMYALLSAETKEKISKEDFNERYSKIYGDLEIANLQVQFTPPEEETDTKEEKISFPFKVELDSLAGKISFENKATLTKEVRDDDTNWYVNWDTTFIFSQLQDGDKIGIKTESAKRGDILDRNGGTLATTGTVFEIGIVPKNMEGQEAEVIGQVSELLGISQEQIENALNASWVKPDYFVPIKKVSPDETELLEKLFAIPSVLKQNAEARVYPFGESTGHLIGYVGPITAEELEKNPGYSSTDVIGKRGLEQILEKRLKGENGVTIYIKKEDGSEEILATKEVKDGENVQITIDGTLQATTYAEFKGEPGMAAALHPLTGETLALVSSPSFNPNILVLGATDAQWKQLEEDERNPLLNRFKSTYAPGSVMKPITASIGLESGAIDWDETMTVEGLKWQKDSSWGSYQVTRVKDPIGPVNLENALLYSDNIYFAQAALKIGKENFIEGLKKFGFDEEFPYSYPIETSNAGRMDKEVTLADSGYGQGQVEMSVIHLASAYTPLINQGNLIKPVLFEEEKKGQIWKENIVAVEQIEKLNAALTKVVQDPEGTAYSGRIEGYPMAGKTGTAELKESQGEKGKENGWFVAYNTENPELLIALMVEGVENSGGSKEAVQKVKAILEN
ncbi:penicillin-binding transpeptidase domain-containing protein [Robertmurraya yapensis]|uniref:serine-type D-Ala-D-Ala carboxypeptidase n=1 Tax=Bacillus yapensis TaxID=2492960 RepID=A0A431WC60_9BACI|nr:penicillin-binding transpeptidase domain-containing protein [Bacillus yapensis]RTR32949.1 penicillin-binding transpeptidase domain-containing protein [Bacillus yapensis]TKS96772.1 penicillin-binding transpeptidase domain-containing protein [Bacillus yapensis]